MAETEERNINIDVNSETFKAGYRQGYLDGMNAMGEKILDKLRALNMRHNAGTDDGK